MKNVLQDSWASPYNFGYENISLAFGNFAQSLCAKNALEEHTFFHVSLLET